MDAATGFEDTGEATLIVAVYVPAANPDGFTATATDAGCVQLVGVTFSHDPPLETAVVTVNAAAPPEACNCTVCTAGFALPMVWLKVRVVGVAVSVCCAATVRLTGISIGLPVA